MNISEFESLFYSCTQNNYDPLPFWGYLQLLLKWNQKINLTSIEDPKAILEWHFLDSLAPLPYLSDFNTVLDVGTGAGFPGLPIKIVKKEIDLHLVESIKKKADFVKTVVRELGIKDVTILNQRFTKSSNIGKFDLIVSRGTMTTLSFFELVEHSLDESGRILLYKGDKPESEIKQFCERYPEATVEVIRYTLPFSKKSRSLLFIRK